MFLGIFHYHYRKKYIFHPTFPLFWKNWILGNIYVQRHGNNSQAASVSHGSSDKDLEMKKPSRKQRLSLGSVPVAFYSEDGS